MYPSLCCPGYGYDMNICFEVLTLWLPCHHELISLQRPLPGWFVCHLFLAQHWAEVKALTLPTPALRCSVPSGLCPEQIMCVGLQGVYTPPPLL